MHPLIEPLKCHHDKRNKHSQVDEPKLIYKILAKRMHL